MSTPAGSFGAECAYAQPIASRAGVVSARSSDDHQATRPQDSGDERGPPRWTAPCSTCDGGLQLLLESLNRRAVVQGRHRPFGAPLHRGAHVRPVFCRVLPVPGDPGR